jgi:ribosome-associated protein
MRAPVHFAIGALLAPAPHRQDSIDRVTLYDMSHTSRIVAHIVSHADWTYSRATGPGGQRRDHVETEVRLTVTLDALRGMPAHTRERLAERLHLDERPLRLRSGTQRLRERNREIVMTRLTRVIEAALAPPPPVRRATRPTRAANERRLSAKRHRATLKHGRGRSDD